MVAVSVKDSWRLLPLIIRKGEYSMKSKLLTTAMGILVLFVLCLSAAAEETHEHSFENHMCVTCELQEAGLYYNGEFKLTWQELLDRGFIRVETKKGDVILYTDNDELQGDMVIAEGVTKIGNSGFDKVKLSSVTFPTTLKVVGDNAFGGSAISTFNMNEGLEEIGGSAFLSCPNITIATFPTSVKKVGSYAYAYCMNLESVIVREGETIEFGGSAFYRCYALKTADLHSVKAVHGFEDCTALETVMLYEGVTHIGREAFSNCGALKTINLPSTVIYIGNEAFNRCSSLTEMRIPDGVTELNDRTFYMCSSLTTLYVGKGLTQINTCAIPFTGLQAIYLPKGLTRCVGIFREQPAWATEVPAVTVYYEGDEFDWMLVEKGDSFDNAQVRCNVNYTYESFLDEVSATLATPEPSATPTAEPTATPTAAPTATPTATTSPTHTPAPTHTTEPAEMQTSTPARMSIPGEMGVYQQVAQQAYVNSYLTASSGIYGAAQAVDGDEETCWQFSTKKIALGEAALDIGIQPGSIVDELWIKNGFWYINNGLDQYTRNGRPKAIGISFLYDGEADFQDEIVLTLKDDKARKDWQKVTLGRHENVSAVRIRVISIYQGTKFKTDVAISEVMLVECENATTRIVYDTLQRGSKGDEVLVMKERLQVLGYFKKGAELSTAYNDTCAERVKQFQKVNGLPQTGIADHQTLVLLYSDAALPKSN